VQDIHRRGSVVQKPCLFIWFVTLSAGMIAKYCIEYVCVCACLSVCQRGYLQNHKCDLYQILCACCLWLWLSPLSGWQNPEGKGQFWGFSAKRRNVQTSPYDSPGILVSDTKGLGEIPMGSPPTGTKYSWGRLQSAIFDQCLTIYQNRCKIVTLEH